MIQAVKNSYIFCGKSSPQKKIVIALNPNIPGKKIEIKLVTPRLCNTYERLIQVSLKPPWNKRGQKRNRATWKMNIFTTLGELWNYDSRNLLSKKRFILRAALWQPSIYYWFYYVWIELTCIGLYVHFFSVAVVGRVAIDFVFLWTK